jgi:hypothetical protein
MLANVAVALAIKRDPSSQGKLTLAAVGVTVIAVCILLPAPQRAIASPTAPSAVFYPSATAPAPFIPAALQYRSL